MNFINYLFTRNTVITILSQIISMTMLLIFSQRIAKFNLQKKHIFIYIFTNIVCFSIIYMLTNFLYAYTFMYITSIILAIFLLKISTSNVFCYFSLKFIINFNIYFLVLKCITNVFDNLSNIFSYPIFNILYITIFSIIVLVIYFSSKHCVFDNLFITCIDQNSKSIIFISSLNLIISGMTFIIFFKNILINPICLLSLDLYFCLSIALIFEICNKLYSAQKLKSLKLCNQTVLNLCDETRAFRHDFHNIIQAIGGYITTNDMEGLKKYYSQIYSDCKQSNNLSKLSPKLINNPAIYNILVDKYFIANTNNIQISLDVMLDLNKLNIKIYELTRILGILLDNAIKASKECNMKKINIEFKKKIPKIRVSS